MPLGPPLRSSFYARDARDVGPCLIGCRLVHRLPTGERLVARLTEVECYLGDGSDAASHAHRGETPRNATMFGPAGRLYAYRSYGLHTCVNVVCARDGRAAAVLLRAAEPLAGLDAMRRLRGLGADDPLAKLTVGPGRLGQAMGLRLADDGRTLLSGRLTLHAPERLPGEVAVGPRVGITKATSLPYRFFEADGSGRPGPWVSVFRAGGTRRRSGR